MSLADERQQCRFMEKGNKSEDKGKASLKNKRGRSIRLFRFFVRPLLNLADDLGGFGETLDHLLAFLSSADSILALTEKVVKFLCLVHVSEELSLHFVFGVSADFIRR
jgi:hypothetical protein